jgi:hypothetical protein
VAHTAPIARPSAYTYQGFTLWPVLDDDDRLDYWDVHDPLDPRGEGDPLAEGLATLAEARAWVRAEVKERRWIIALDGHMARNGQRWQRGGDT